MQRDANREITYCAEREWLKDAFLMAVHELAELQALQTNAVIRGNGDLERIERLIQSARRAKNAAKSALAVHMESHCSPRNTDSSYNAISALQGRPVQRVQWLDPALTKG